MKVERPHLAASPDAKVARGDPLRQVAALRKREADVADFDPLQNLVVQPLVVDVDIVRRIELTTVVVVDAYVDSVGDRAAHPGAELNVRFDGGDKTGRAVLGHRVAWAKPIPAATHLDPTLDRDPQVGVFAEYIRQHVRLRQRHAGATRHLLLQEQGVHPRVELVKVRYFRRRRRPGRYRSARRPQRQLLAG